MLEDLVFRELEKNTAFEQQESSDDESVNSQNNNTVTSSVGKKSKKYSMYEAWHLK